MWATIAGIVGIIASVLAWWFGGKKERDRKAIIGRIRNLERRHDEALAQLASASTPKQKEAAMANLAIIQSDLVRLRQEVGRHPPKR